MSGLLSTPYAVNAGFQAGLTGQATGGIAFGWQAGSYNQASGCIAIGPSAGFTGQSTGSVAIGSSAGRWNQGLYSIAIGNLAAPTGQASNSIVLNASGAALNATGSGLYIQPINNQTTAERLLVYNPTSKELQYSLTSARLSSGGIMEINSVSQDTYIALNSSISSSFGSIEVFNSANTVKKNLALCAYGGAVTVGTTAQANSSAKLSVNGLTNSSGFYTSVANVYATSAANYAFPISTFLPAPGGGVYMWTCYRLDGNNTGWAACGFLTITYGTTFGLVGTTTISQNISGASITGGGYNFTLFINPGGFPDNFYVALLKVGDN